jgi:hypothetical protein
MAISKILGGLFFLLDSKDKKGLADLLVKLC